MLQLVSGDAAGFPRPVFDVDRGRAGCLGQHLGQLAGHGTGWHDAILVVDRRDQRVAVAIDSQAGQPVGRGVHQAVDVRLRISRQGHAARDGQPQQGSQRSGRSQRVADVRSLRS